MKTFKHMESVEPEVTDWKVRFLMEKYGLKEESARNIAMYLDRIGERVHENV